MRTEYAEAVERQSAWLRFSESEAGSRMWRDMVAQSRNPYERAVHEAPLRHGEVFYVSEEFCHLIDVAQRTLPDATFREDMVPVPCGWAWLERPLALPMTAAQERIARGEAARIAGRPVEIMVELKVDAIGWTRHAEDGGAYSFTAYSSRRDDEAELVAFPTDTVSKGRVRLSDFLFTPVANFTMSEGDSLARRVEEFEGAAETESRYVRTDVHEMRYAFAMLLLMEQRILSHRREPLDRPTRRRLARSRPEGSAPHEHLQVVTLRRYDERAPDSGPARETDWSCRWIVHGFWRQQWYPSSRVHRPRWILPYIKGPADKPLKDDDRRRVYAAVR